MKFNRIFVNYELKSTNKKHLFILFFILLIAIFFRFYNFPYRYLLGDELVREAIVGIQGARTLQAPLIGGFSSAGRFTWGPWFYYQMIVANLIFRNLYSSWIYLGLASVLCVFVLYKIGEELEGKNLGIVLALIGAFSPALILSGIQLTFPNLTSIFALGSILIFIKLVKKDISYWWSFSFGIILGIGINIHYQMAGLLVLPVLLLISKGKKINYFLTSIIGIGITFIPLLLFDLSNHWFNLRGVLFYYVYGKNAIYVANSWKIYLGTFWPGVFSDAFGLPKILSIILIVFISVTLIYSIYKKRISKPLVLLIIAFLFNFIQLRYYWGERSFAYLNHVRAFVFIFTGYSFVITYKLISENKSFTYLKYSVIIFGILIFATTVPNSFKLLQTDPFTIGMHSTAQNMIAEYPNKTFSIYICQKSYKGNDAPISKSILFLLEVQNKISSNGIKVGITGEGSDPAECSVPKKAEPLPKTQFSNFSKIFQKDLQKSGWSELTFQSIYNTTVRWWYKEQP